MKRKIIWISALLILLIGTFSVVKSSDEIMAKIANYSIFINGEKFVPENTPVVINDRTYLPVREIAELLNMDVQWTEEEQKITICDPNVEETKSLYPFEYNGLFGYINNERQVVIEPQYIWAGEFCEGLACVSVSSGQNGEYGYINETGEIVIPCTYYRAYDFSNGVALVSLATHTDEGKWTYIDKQGNRLFDKEFALAYSFSEGYALVLKEGYAFPVSWANDVPRKWAFIDKGGNFVTDMNFEEAQSFCNGYARVKNNGKWGLIDQNFNIVIPYQYDDIKELDNIDLP